MGDDQMISIGGYQIPLSTLASLDKPQESIAQPTSVYGAAQIGNPITAPAQGFQLGANLPTAQLGLAGIGALGSLWNSFNANSLARDQLNFTKKVTNTNLNNQMKSYNTALEDRARARGAVEGQSQDQIDEYINTNRMTR